MAPCTQLFRSFKHQIVEQSYLLRWVEVVEVHLLRLFALYPVDKSFTEYSEVGDSFAQSLRLLDNTVSNVNDVEDIIAKQEYMIFGDLVAKDGF